LPSKKGGAPIISPLGGPQRGGRGGGAHIRVQRNKGGPFWERKKTRERGGVKQTKEGEST